MARQSNRGAIDIDADLYRKNLGRGRGTVLSTTTTGIILWERLLAHFERACSEDQHVMKGRLLEKVLREACERYGC